MIRIIQNKITFKIITNSNKNISNNIILNQKIKSYINNNKLVLINNNMINYYKIIRSQKNIFKLHNTNLHIIFKKIIKLGRKKR